VTTLTLVRKVDSTRRAAKANAPSSPEILAQRSSTLEAAGAVAAPAIVDAGRPLDTGTRGAMQDGFGRDFSSIRVHDDARAHDNARSLGARAYAAGDHIVFGEGAFRPETQRGRALIAHELAHSVQQGGVQMKADGTIPAARDAELEAQADRAALDVTAGRRVSALHSIGRPAIFRADGDPPAAAPATTPEAAGSATDLPPDVEVIEETPRGTGATVLVVSLPLLTLPRVKGKGDWVQKAYSAIATGNRLVFNPIFDGPGTTIRAFMEKPGDKYKDIWLNNYGFTDLKGLGKGIRTAVAADPALDATLQKPGVETIVKGFELGKLPSAGCDIDHIVEKQVGGTSVSGNLQLLVSDKNQESGRETYNFLVAETKRILEPNRKFVKTFQIRYKDVKVLDDVEDASFHIETLLRTGQVKGAAEVMKKAEGIPIQLVAGGASEVVRVRAAGSTPVDAAERRLISGMRFINYLRTPGSSPTKGTDKVEAELLSKPVLPGKGKGITLTATITPAPTPAADDPSAGASAAEKAAASEVRKLTLDPVANKDIKFYYPYLSEGTFTKLEVDENRNLIGEGVITPSVKFLGPLKVKFGPDTLALVQDINTDAINSSAFIKPISSMFRFTNGSVSIDLVKFKPQGTMDMELGPRGKPVILGTVAAKEEGGQFVMTGTLQPGGSIPGIKEAKGEVSYRSDTGWAGALSANTTTIPNSEASVKLGFKEDKGAFRPYAEGAIKTTIRNSTLKLNVAWGGGSVTYSGGVKIEKPFPMIDSVNLNGRYNEGVIWLTGEAPITWRSISSTLTVVYSRKDGEEGKFSGTATFAIKTEKADGSVTLNYNEDGSFSGKGTVSYQITKDIRPTLGVELKAGKVRMFGEVALKDIPLTRMWPAPNGGKLDFIKGVGAKFPFPLPPPLVGVSAFIEIRASAGLGYGVGPLTLKGIVFKGELYPLEDDPKVLASVKGKLVVPAYAEIWGTFGAYVGLEVLAGAAGVKGGIDVTPSLRVTGETGIETIAEYKDQAFTFYAEAFARGQMEAGLKVDLVAQIYALYGLLEHTWTYNALGVRAPLGPELILKIGRVEYGKNGEITWPNTSQMSLEPKNLDPATLVTDFLKKGKTTKA
jgi:hypothetical protein